MAITTHLLPTIATGLLGGSFTHSAIAKRCCVRPWRLPLGEAQIAHSIPSQQTSPILIATAYTDLTLPTLRQGDRGRNVELLQRILQDNGFLGAAGVRLGNPSGAIVDGIFGEITASAIRDVQQRYEIPVTGQVNPTTWEVLDVHANPYRSPLPWVSTPASIGNKLTVVDLQSADWKPRKLVDNLDDQWSVVGNVGTKFFLRTTQDAPRFKVVTMDIAAADPVIADVVPEQDSVLGNASLVSGRLLISTRVDVKTEVRRYTLDGKPDGMVKLPGIGTAGGFKSDPDDSETFFIFTSFNTPGVIYRYDVASNTAQVWAKPKVAIDLNRIAVEQRFYKSKDGTRIPMFIVRRKDVNVAAPTLLYAYGGFGIPMLPEFLPAPLGWVEQGGVYAVANIRGGSEYGKAWHEAGRRQKKQNVFDDFIAAGEYLKAQSITPQNGLAIQGGSNGGLLIGAVVNQRPDLFAAALPQVGVMDMLRFDQFTGGKLWLDEYGSPAREADFPNLLKYSPYHNIQPGKAYPAILVTTADTDDRVVPGHTFKYVAALQAADIGDKPHLARIETRAGHGAGEPTDKIIEETADMWAFAAHWTGLDVKPAK